MGGGGGGGLWVGTSVFSENTVTSFLLEQFGQTCLP